MPASIIRDVTHRGRERTSSVSCMMRRTTTRLHPGPRPSVPCFRADPEGARAGPGASAAALGSTPPLGVLGTGYARSVARRHALERGAPGGSLTPWALLCVRGGRVNAREHQRGLITTVKREGVWWERPHGEVSTRTKMLFVSAEVEAAVGKNRHQPEPRGGPGCLSLQSLLPPRVRLNGSLHRQCFKIEY
jgi:hypothetical protein